LTPGRGENDMMKFVNLCGRAAAGIASMAICSVIVVYILKYLVYLDNIYRWEDLYDLNSLIFLMVIISLFGDDSVTFYKFNSKIIAF
jgi:hypothetical protein